MKYSKSQSGFSLVETLVAVTILLILIVTPMTTTIRSANSASFSTEQVTAYFLAQEGAELAQLARNNLLLEEVGGNPVDSWADFVSGAGDYQDCFDPSGCGLEITDFSDGRISADVCSGDSCRIYVTETSGGSHVRSRFTHDSNQTPTPFTRTINLTDLGSQVRVQSVVTWRTGSLRQEQRAEVETYLFDLSP